MDLASVTGLLLGIILILTAIAVGGSVKIFLDFPSVLITMGGTLAGILINYSMDDIKGLIAVVKNAFVVKLPKAEDVIEEMVRLAEVSRRDGLLALEAYEFTVTDEFLRKGVELVVDGQDPGTIRQMLDIELSALEARHALGQRILRTMASLAPAFGMVGTLIGLIQMLRNLDSPEKLGPGMAVALLTSLYGALWANLVCNPLAGKLELRSEQEMLVKTIILEGLLAIRKGEPARLVRDKLYGFLSPRRRAEHSESVSDQKDETGTESQESGQGMVRQAAAISR